MGRTAVGQIMVAWSRATPYPNAMLTIIAAASLLSVPEMVTVEADYPVVHMQNFRSAAALMDVVIDAEGQPVSCQTLDVFGDAKFGRDICTLQKEFRYKPALDNAGEPVPGIIRILVKYVLIGAPEAERINRLTAPVEFEVVGVVVRRGSRPPDIDAFNKASGEPQPVLLPDVTFDVSSLPGMDSGFVDQRVVVSVDAGGRVTECAADSAPEGDGDKAAYADAACQQLRNMEIADPLLIDDSPVNYVKSLQVRFVVTENG